jgi:C-terminal peptidase prc
MMRLRLLALPLLALPLATLAPSAPSSQDLAALLAERARAASALDDEGLWAEAGVLEELLLADEEGGADAVLDGLLASAAELPERGRLLLVALRLSGDSPDHGLLAGVLRGLFDSEDQGVREIAAGLAAGSGFTQIDADDLSDLLQELLDGAEDGDNRPSTRLAFAAAAHAHGGGAARRDARKVMREFLESSSAELRAAGALALAGIGDLETARPELERLRLQPGAQGRLAEAYLRNDDLKVYYESRLRSQRAALAEAQSDAEVPEDLDAVENMIGLILNRHIEGDVVRREELIDAALNGMLQSLDQHSSYMNEESFTRFQQDLQGEYGGIGAYVNIDRSDNLFTITQPIYSGPAYQADLRSDDKIVQIDDWPTHEHGISKDQDEIIRRLKGKPDTVVRLYIWRRGMDPELIDRPTEDMAVEVKRGFITIPTVKHDLLPGNVGLVQLDQFSGVASQEVAKALVDLLQRGAESLVLDLRNNPGGLLSEARNVTDLFLPRGKRVVSTESRVEEPEVLNTRTDALWPEDRPVVVLINRFSASASEIVSGALQDHGRAVLVGQRSFGKGSVQHLISLGQDDDYRDENRNRNRDNWEPLTRDLNGNGEFDYAPRAKLTIARYLLPSGRSIHRELDEEGNVVSPGGVAPEFVVDPRRYDAWRLEAMFDLQEAGTLKDWVLDRWEGNKEGFVQLAFTDHKDPGAYPGFEELYEELDTPLSREDVRFMIRREVRRLAQDERGSSFPRGDFQEDLQLQKGIQVLFEELGRSTDDVEAYRSTFEVAEDLSGGGLVARATTGGAARSAELREARAWIERALSDQASLTPEELQQLEKLLGELGG